MLALHGPSASDEGAPGPSSGRPVLRRRAAEPGLGFQLATSGISMSRAKAVMVEGPEMERRMSTRVLRVSSVAVRAMMAWSTWVSICFRRLASCRFRRGWVRVFPRFLVAVLVLDQGQADPASAQAPLYPCCSACRL